jgi:hypothetical protein
MKSANDYSKQIQYGKTMSLLIAVDTWRVVGIVFLWRMTQGLLDSAFAIPAGVGMVV